MLNKFNGLTKATSVILSLLASVPAFAMEMTEDKRVDLQARFKKLKETPEKEKKQAQPSSLEDIKNRFNNITGGSFFKEPSEENQNVPKEKKPLTKQEGFTLSKSNLKHRKPVFRDETKKQNNKKRKSQKDLKETLFKRERKYNKRVEKIEKDVKDKREQKTTLETKIVEKKVEKENISQNHQKQYEDFQTQVNETNQRIENIKGNNRLLEFSQTQKQQVVDGLNKQIIPLENTLKGLPQIQEKILDLNTKNTKARESIENLDCELNNGKALLNNVNKKITQSELETIGHEKTLGLISNQLKQEEPQEDFSEIEKILKKQAETFTEQSLPTDFKELHSLFEEVTKNPFVSDKAIIKKINSLKRKSSENYIKLLEDNLLNDNLLNPLCNLTWMAFKNSRLELFEYLAKTKEFFPCELKYNIVENLNSLLNRPSEESPDVPLSPEMILPLFDSLKTYGINQKVINEGFAFLYLRAFLNLIDDKDRQYVHGLYWPVLKEIVDQNSEIKKKKIERGVVETLHRKYKDLPKNYITPEDITPYLKDIKEDRDFFESKESL